MDIEIIQKKYLQKVYVFHYNGIPHPIYLDTRQTTKHMSKAELTNKLEQKTNVCEYKDNEQKVLSTVPTHRICEMNWFKLDGEEIPFQDKNIHNQPIIERLIVKILKPSTTEKLRQFLYSILIQLIEPKDWSMKQKFIAVCKAFSVSDLPFYKKKKVDIGFEDIGRVKGTLLQDLHEVNGVYHVYGTRKKTAMVNRGAEVIAWKDRKYWLVCDKINDTCCKIREDLIHMYFKPHEVTTEGTAEFVRAREAIDRRNQEVYGDSNDIKEKAGDSKPKRKKKG